MARPYKPTERKYRLPDSYSHQLFRKVFEAYGLDLYRYKGTQRRTTYCSGPLEQQQAAFQQFLAYEGRMQRALERAVDQLYERWTA